MEPDTFAYGTTEVSAYQTGRFSNGGSSNLGFATTTNGGSTWTSGFLLGTTVYASPSGRYARITDPSVVYDATHKEWLIVSLALSQNAKGVAVLVSRSADGLTWGNPTVVASSRRGENFDKTWVGCDNTASTFAGHCYATFDDFGHGDRMKFSTSADGGNSWSTPVNTADNATGLGGQPVVQPNGTVIVPFANANETAILAAHSANGGLSWSSTVVVSSVSTANDPGSIRAGPLPSAEIDASGTVYAVWEDCRFESGCAANDIVLSSTGDGVSWSSPVGVPIDSVGSGVDHLIPGIGVDPSTSGSTARIGLTYYFFPSTSCTSSTCQLEVGYISSANGGSTWSAPTTLAGPMTPTWLASTNQGYMVGDYISTSFLGGTAHPVFAVASAPAGTVLAESMDTPSAGLGAPGGSTPVISSATAAVAPPKTNPSDIHSAGGRQG